MAVPFLAAAARAVAVPIATLRRRRVPCCVTGCAALAGCGAAASVISLAVVTAVLGAAVGGVTPDDVCGTACTGEVDPMQCHGLSVSQGFGDTPWEHPHTGVDIVCPRGTPVVAMLSGVAHVLSGGTGACLFPAGRRGGLGDFVAVSSGSVTVLYGHLDRWAVHDGGTVAPGTLLGWEGATGCATGPHLHLEVDRNGRAVDPCPFLPATYPAAHVASDQRCWGTAPP
ncbi:MAG: M23 family metallopeptidase [Candidatus Dormibacteraeota bacterium]|nr:M23 family metallopeptidase [Candidatus Dormibacteraeota bacterium]